VDCLLENLPQSLFRLQIPDAILTATQIKVLVSRRSSLALCDLQIAGTADTRAAAALACLVAGDLQKEWKLDTILGSIESEAAFFGSIGVNMRASMIQKKSRKHFQSSLTDLSLDTFDATTIAALSTWLFNDQNLRTLSLTVRVS
jgi:hypothetical protein